MFNIILMTTSCLKEILLEILKFTYSISNNIKTKDLEYLNSRVTLMILYFMNTRI